MCFSAAASFGTAAALTVVGLATLRSAHGWRETPLAAVPLLFAVQQYAEGLLWLRLESGEADRGAVILAHLFLLVAEVVWPVLVPIAALLLEPDARRRRWMLPFALLGAVVGAVLLAAMVVSPYQPSIRQHSILYANGLEYIAGSELFYVAAVTAPLLLSSRRTIFAIGVMDAALFFVARYLYSATYVSVWCFFAAAVSVLVAAHFHVLRGGAANPLARGRLLPLRRPSSTAPPSARS
jgi:hypothetical protein